MGKIIYRLSLCVLLLAGIGNDGYARQKESLPFSNYIHIRSGLENVRKKIARNRQTTVAFLGGSITYNPGWRDSVCNYLLNAFPQTRFKFIAAGIPSLGSIPHAFRLQRDVLDSGKVDLLFLEAAVNDQVNHTDSILQVRALEGIVRHAKYTNPQMDIVLMSFADPDKSRSYDQGIVPVSVTNHELVAAHYGLPSINLAKAVRDKIANGEFSWERDFVDLHPSPFGQALYFRAIRELLNNELAERNKKAYIHRGNAGNGLPPALDKASFTNGYYLAIGNATAGTEWKLDQDWIPGDQMPTREGFVHVPLLYALQPGAALSLKFKGNAAGIATVSGADTGIIIYHVDNGPEQVIDLFTEWSNFLYLPWYVVLASGLPDGEHTLYLKISTEKNPASKGNACRIVNFLINEGTNK